MKLTESQIKFMQESISEEIIEMLIENWHCPVTEAMNMYYNSDTFEKLKNPATGLYYQSPGYVYAFLQNEIITGKLS